MRRPLAKIEYPEHGDGYTLPRLVLVMETRGDLFVCIDMEEYIKTGDVAGSYRTFKMSKIPHRGMTTISFPRMNKEKDFPYPRTERLDKIADGLKKNHKGPAY